MRQELQQQRPYHCRTFGDAGDRHVLSGAACFGASRALHTVTKVVDQALDSLPQNFAAAFIMSPFRQKICHRSGHHLSRASKGGCWVASRACPQPRRAYLTLSTGPHHIVLYRKNIEAVCSTEAEVRGQIRLTASRESTPISFMSGRQKCNCLGLQS
jgi:hypothetical protein